ncbi:MAG: RusA family crossover junction endodeoxyribonuclease [Oscillospiraceae bacterium]|nr:RusA family crossover junction endodeoxyribonuclease [Oscillospiraceae bacterium]
MIAKFSVPGCPTGKGRPRFDGRSGRTYTPEKTARYENLVKIEYQSQCGGIRFSDVAMLDMRVIAYYQPPKSVSKKKREMMLSGKARPLKVPDVDNIIKSIADSLNGIAYRDDRQIVDCQVRKFYSDEPRVVVIIREVEAST